MPQRKAPTQAEAAMVMFTLLGGRMVAVLNRCLKTDPDAILSLVAHRVPCGPTIADDPAIQVLETKEGPLLGMLGLLNGILGALPDGTGRLHAVVEGDQLVRFELR